MGAGGDYYSNGYQVVYIWCPRCEHQGMISPKRFERARTLQCRKCFLSDVRSNFQSRIIYMGDEIPDNVTPIRRRE
jgi:hypothetical protein